MSLIRIILITIAVYLISNVLKTFFQHPVKKESTKGKTSGSDPLDLSNAEIEDVDFEEIDEK
jgi:Na+-transporting methylmalonyl-CoA/oxaloacetate decarboxylase gamma subunit